MRKKKTYYTETIKGYFDELEEFRKRNRDNPDKNPVWVYAKWCKGCGICEAMCPNKVFGHDADGTTVVLRPEDCTRCGICEISCPDFAITLGKVDPKEVEK